MKASEIRNYLATSRPEVLYFLDSLYITGVPEQQALISLLERSQDNVVNTFLYYVPNNGGQIKVKDIDDLLSLEWSETWGTVIHGYCVQYQKSLPWYKVIVGKLVCWLILKVPPVIYQEATIYRALLNRLASL